MWEGSASRERDVRKGGHHVKHREDKLLSSTDVPLRCFFKPPPSGCEPLPSYSGEGKPSHRHWRCAPSRAGIRSCQATWPLCANREKAPLLEEVQLHRGAKLGELSAGWIPAISSRRGQAPTCRTPITQVRTVALETPSSMASKCREAPRLMDHQSP